MLRRKKELAQNLKLNYRCSRNNEDFRSNINYINGS